MVALARRLRCSSACGGAASGGARPWRFLGHVAGSGAGDFAWLAFLQRRPGRPHRRPGFAYPLRVPSASDGETATCGSAAAQISSRCFGNKRPIRRGLNLRVTFWASKRRPII
ncbi:hypothetical protein PVAP13_9KG638301 [Panicum virgatum]|uniref:Uncharacterized protein n=1 Tax=Panicum virgatum TaxID=38727 RepID=A0A8T0P022_PANVG|nr:hypothetical protein PVAP13_9KG638301 [Panicum virgatum]